MQNINLNNYEAFLLDYFEGNLTELEIIELKQFANLNPQLNINLNAIELPILKSKNNTFEFKNSLKKDDFYTENEEVILYLENKLPQNKLSEFKQKLSENASLQIAVNEFKKVYFIPETVKEKLNKENYYISHNYNLQFLLFNYFEGNLTHSEKLKFEDELISNKILQNEIKLYSKTKQIAENVVFDKSILYKLNAFEIKNLSIDSEAKFFPNTINRADLTLKFPNKNNLKKSSTKIITLYNSFKFVAVAALIILVINICLKLFLNQNYIGKSMFTSNLKFHSHKLVAKNNSIASINPYLLKNASFNSMQNSIKTTVIKNNTNITNDSLNFNNNKTLVNSTLKKDSIINNNSFKIATTTTSNSTIDFEKIEPLLVIKEIQENNEEEDLVPVYQVKKSNFWSKLVNLSNNLNLLGLKALKTKTNTNNYSIAYKSFAIEKK